MAKPVSAGCLLYRFCENTLEVLLVHPSGAYNRRSPFSIPKGLLDPAEELEQAARRETLEETGVVAGDLHPLGRRPFPRLDQHRAGLLAVTGQPEVRPAHPALLPRGGRRGRAEQVHAERGLGTSWHTTAQPATPHESTGR